MFGIEIFEWTPISGNQVLGGENRVFNSGEPNVINKFQTGRYHVAFPEDARVGTLMGRGENTFALAIEQATSGTNSTSLTYRIDTYWEDDKAAAIALGATDFPCDDGWCDANAQDRIPPDCDGDGRKVNADGTCGICKDGYTEDSNGDCIAPVIVCTDSNRKTLTDGSCDTDCKDDYVFDSSNKCVSVSGDDTTPTDTNYLLFGGIGVAVLIGLFVMKK